MPDSVRIYDSRVPGPAAAVGSFHVRGENDITYFNGTQTLSFVVPSSGGGGKHVLSAYADYPSPAPTGINFSLVIPANPGGTAFAEWSNLVLFVRLSAAAGHIRNYPIAALSELSGAGTHNIDVITPYTGSGIQISFEPNVRTIHAFGGTGLQLAFAALTG